MKRKARRKKRSHRGVIVAFEYVINEVRNIGFYFICFISKRAHKIFVCSAAGKQPSQLN